MLYSVLLKLSLALLISLILSHSFILFLPGPRRDGSEPRCNHVPRVTVIYSRRIAAAV
jgi:hypothetical protein